MGGGGGMYRHEGVIWCTEINDLQIHSVRTVCMYIYIYLPRIFAFQLYLIFKVHQRRDVRPAVYNIVQIVLFFSHPLCVRKLCDEGQNALHITILKLLFPMILIIILYELRFVISDLKIGTS